jgi:glycine cleavage system aminomethyltransferase T
MTTLDPRLGEMPVAPMVPVDPNTWTYTRFINAFEAAEFTGWQDESLSWKKTAYIGDWSQLSKLRIQGPDAHAFLAFLSTGQWLDFRVHQCKHSIMCRDDGFIVGEGLILKVGPEDFIYTTGPPAVEWARFQHSQHKFNVTFEDVSDDWYLFHIQGPKSIEIMEAATGTGIKDVFFMNAKEMSIDGKKFLALRQGVSGERGYELWGPTKDGPAVYKALFEAGKPFGIRQLGMRTKLVNHVSCFCRFCVSSEKVDR